MDYVKLNGDLFGDAVLDGDEEEKKDIKQPIDRRAQIAALVALKKKNDDDNNNNNKKKIRNKKWNKNGVTTTSPPARSGTTRKRTFTTSRGYGRRTKDKASMSTPTKKRRGKSSSHSSPFTLPKPKAHETKNSRTLSPARGGRKRSF